MTHVCRVVSLSALLAPAAVLAHPDGHHAATFFEGLAHPITGIDHLLAMLAVGMIAAKAPATERWVAPASFLACMLVGSMAGASGWHVPYMEFAIACSVFLFGAVTLAKRSLPSVIVAPLFGTFALFHGIAHGAEANDVGLVYVAGVLTMTAALHALGFVCVCYLRAKQPRVLRFVARARDSVHQRTHADLIVRD